MKYHIDQFSLFTKHALLISDNHLFMSIHCLSAHTPPVHLYPFASRPPAFTIAILCVPFHFCCSSSLPPPPAKQLGYATFCCWAFALVVGAASSRYSLLLRNSAGMCCGCALAFVVASARSRHSLLLVAPIGLCRVRPLSAPPLHTSAAAGVLVW